MPDPSPLVAIARHVIIIYAAIATSFTTVCLTLRTVAVVHRGVRSRRAPATMGGPAARPLFVALETERPS